MFNPFNETLYFKLFIGRSTHESLNASELNRINDRRTSRMEHELSAEERHESAFGDEGNDDEPKISNKYYYKRLETRLPDMQKYCTKLRGAENAQQVEEGSAVWMGTSDRPR